MWPRGQGESLESALGSDRLGPPETLIASVSPSAGGGFKPHAPDSGAGRGRVRVIFSSDLQVKARMSQLLSIYTQEQKDTSRRSGTPAMTWQEGRPSWAGSQQQSPEGRHLPASWPKSCQTGGPGRGPGPPRGAGRRKAPVAHRPGSDLGGGV